MYSNARAAALNQCAVQFQFVKGTANQITSSFPLAGSASSALMHITETIDWLTAEGAAAKLFGHSGGTGDAKAPVTTGQGDTGPRGQTDGTVLLQMHTCRLLPLWKRGSASMHMEGPAFGNTQAAVSMGHWRWGRSGAGSPYPKFSLLLRSQ